MRVGFNIQKLAILRFYDARELRLSICVQAELGPQFFTLQTVHKQMSIDINCIAVIGKQVCFCMNQVNSIPSPN